MAKQPNKQPRKSTVPSAPQAQATTSAHAPRSARRPDSVRRRKEERQKAVEREKRNRLLIRVGAIAVAAIVIAAIAVPLYNRFSAPDVSADVTSYFGPTDFTGSHPQNVTEILYEEVPPVGGPHNAVWQNCGFYDKYIFNWHGVHALEHGAVWLAYDPNLSDEDKQQIEKIAEQSYILASPYPGMDAPVIGSVWGKQMKFDGVDDDRIQSFIDQYKRNPKNTPEPNAVCWGGTSITTDQEPQQQPYQQADASAPPIGGITSIDATATAQAGQAPVSTPVASGSPVASPVASPAASPGATPATSVADATPAG
jgi:hypothetical protein